MTRFFYLIAEIYLKSENLLIAEKWIEILIESKEIVENSTDS